MQHSKHTQRTCLRLLRDAHFSSCFVFVCSGFQWPHNDASPSGWASAQPFTLALEGFFENTAQSGAADSVCCYACGTSLISWSPEDVPHAEHVRHARDKACPLLTLRAQTGVSPSDLAIAAGLVKPSEAELAAAMAASSASASASASMSSAMARMHAAYSASEAILAESSARMRDRDRVSFPSYHGVLSSLDIARNSIANNAASSSASSSSSSKPAGLTRMNPRLSGGYTVVGGTGGSSVSLARAGLTVPLSASERAVGRSPSPGTPSLSPPAAAVAAAAPSLDKSDPLYLPVPAADLHDIVYVRSQASSASVHAPKSASSSGYLAFLDAYAGDTAGLGPGAGSPSRLGLGVGVVTSSTPLSAFDRIRARHLKRSHSLFSADTYSRNWPDFDDEDASTSAASSAAGLSGSKLPPTVAAELARVQAATASAKESYRAVKRVRHQAAKSALSGDASANQVLADLQQRVAISKQRYSTAKAMEQALTQSLQRQQQQKDEQAAAGGGMSDEEEAPSSPSAAAPVSSAMLHALLLQEITTAALLHSTEQ